MCTHLIQDDQARFFAEDWGTALAYDFALDCRKLKYESISIFKLILGYKGYDELMAKRPNKLTGNFASSKPVWLNVNLSDDMVQEAIEGSTDANDLLGSVAGLVLMGYAISVKISSDEQSIMCTMLKVADDNPAKTLGLSAFAPTPHEAIALLLSKFYAGLDGQWVGGQGDTVSKYR